MKEKDKNLKTGKPFAKIPKYKFYFFFQKLIIKFQASKSLKPFTSNTKPHIKFIP